MKRRPGRGKAWYEGIPYSTAAFSRGFFVVGTRLVPDGTLSSTLGLGLLEGWQHPLSLKLSRHWQVTPGERYWQQLGLGTSGLNELE